MIPAFGHEYACGTLLDVPLVLRLVRGFLKEGPQPRAPAPPPPPGWPGSSTPTSPRPRSRPGSGRPSSRISRAHCPPTRALPTTRSTAPSTPTSR
ncbi:hypothetical protein GUJ93_ZPchr0001g31597 [Zizania palustris]|uniref:Uncharacterized protein n=1 Tax=Zizania palustris TaxID=103762 RepID=A0A8J5S1G0_ZIZPA|nr:hypothetical protein GUJ93_ZPchr0001g31597 [Zizania palustris]